jgi:type II restriction/modification system DNA methylase subunit YeeA
MCHRISRNSPIIEAQCQSNKILYFTSTDTENLFELNKKTQGEEWIYYNKKIEYKYKLDSKKEKEAYSHPPSSSSPHVESSKTTSNNLVTAIVAESTCKYKIKV